MESGSALFRLEPQLRVVLRPVEILHQPLRQFHRGSLPPGGVAEQP